MKRQDGFDKQIEFIHKHKINNLMLAGLIGVGRSVFSEKVMESRGNKFTDQQKVKIMTYLDQLKKDITNLK